jgi:hypothetical protein
VLCEMFLWADEIFFPLLLRFHKVHL